MISAQSLKQKIDFEQRNDFQVFPPKLNADECKVSVEPSPDFSHECPG